MKGGIFLGLGSNLGDRIANLRQAEDRLGLPVVRRSSDYETAPVDYLDQGWFMNCVLEVSTDATPQDLLKLCLRVESEMGRVRRIAKGPRVVDVDILLYRDTVLLAPELTIPHPLMDRRRFVLEPLAEIASHTVHPVLGRTIAELLASCPDHSAVHRLQAAHNRPPGIPPA